MSGRFIFPVFLFLMAAVFLCCGEKGQEEAAERQGWPDRTGREDCLKIMEMAYNRKDIDKYSNIFLKPDSAGAFPAGYKVYFLRENADSAKFSFHMNYSDEIKTAAGLFKHADSLWLKMSPADWERVEEFRGIKCHDCWKTEREYDLMARLEDSKVVNGHYLARYVIGPDPNDKGKYLIYQIEIAPPESESGLKGFPLVDEFNSS